MAENCLTFGLTNQDIIVRFLVSLFYIKVQNEDKM